MDHFFWEMGEPAEHCTKPQELHYTNAPRIIIAGIIFLKIIPIQTVDKMEKILTSPPFPSPLNPYPWPLLPLIPQKMKAKPPKL